MFNIEEGQESTGNSVQYIEPGINIVTLKSIVSGKKNVRGTETVVAIFTFENETGGTTEYTLFPFDAESDFVRNKIGTDCKYNAKVKHYKTGADLAIAKGKKLTEDEAKSLALDNWINEIKHIKNRFDVTISVKGNDFNDLAKNLIIALKPFFGVKKIKLAAIKNGKYTNIKKYVPFLADLEDTKTLEALNLNSEEPKPDNDDVPQAPQNDNSDWATEIPKAVEPKEDDLPF